MIRIKLLYEELSTLALTEANYPNFALRLHKNFISASPKNMPPRMGSNRTVAISSGEITTKISIIPLKQGWNDSIYTAKFIFIAFMT